MIKTGQILNDTYEIIERLGSGAGGIIFKAYHRRMQKYVAIKLIKDDIKEKLNNRSEVDVLKNLKHEYLPQVHDFIEDGGEVYTVMEFIEGQNFKQIITSGRQFDEKSVRKYALQLCEAVEYLHNHKPPIIHSDIKPANIMLTLQDTICLIDFNISMVSDNGVAVAAGGSRGFAAPEQFKRVISTPISVDEFHEETRFIDNDNTEILPDSEQTGSKSISRMRTKDTARAFIDIRTDIYGIGASVYYMLTSRIPVVGQLDFRGVRCSAQIREVIEKAMNPDPSKRYRNVTELKRALQSHISKKMLAVPAAAVCIAALSAAVISSGVFDRIAEMPANDTVTQTVSESVAADVTTVSTLSETIITTTEPTTTAESTATEEITTTATVAVPSLVGLSESEAIEACTAAGLTYDIKSAESDTVEKGFVSNQMIPAEANVPLGYKLVFTVSEGKMVKMVTVPSVLNKSYIDAITALDNAGLQHKITYEDDSRVQKGYVFKQSHKSGSSVEENTVITIYISTHEEVDKKTPAELAETKAADIDNKDEYVTIKGKQYALTTTVLDLSDSDLYDKDIQPLSLLVNLKELDLSGNHLTDIKPLSDLTNLTYLNLEGHDIENIEPLKKLVHLKTLNLNRHEQDNMITLSTKVRVSNEIFNSFNEREIDKTPLNLSPLSDMTELEILYLCGNGINDIQPLSGCISLKLLDLSENTLSDISALSLLTNLVKLNADDNFLENVSSLKNLTNLNYLNLSNNELRISEDSYRGADEDEITERENEINELQTFLPECEILNNNDELYITPARHTLAAEFKEGDGKELTRSSQNVEIKYVNPKK